MSFSIRVQLESKGKFFHGDDYKCTFNGRLGERYHFCTGFDLYDVEVSFFKLGSFGWESVDFELVPEEMKETFAEQIKQEIQTEMVDDDKKYMTTVIHVGEDSGWSYSEKSKENQWLVDNLGYESYMVIDDEDDMDLREYLFRRRDFDIDIGIVDREFEKEEEQQPIKGGGITEEMLEKYLQEVA